MKDAFHEMDQDHTGLITLDELKQMFEKKNYKITN